MPPAPSAADRARRSFVDRMGHVAEADGLSPIAGRLFATLLLSDEARSLDELAAELGVSKASVSTDARRLFERGIVERVTRPGDRRDYYELAPEFFAAIIRDRIARWRRIQTLVDGLRGTPVRLSPALRARATSIDEIDAFVVARAESALNEWERRAKRGGVRNARRAAKHRRPA